MKNILLIGLGRFGLNAAKKLRELDHEVLAVDENEERVNDAMPYVTEARIGDCTRADFVSWRSATIFSRRLKSRRC